MAEESDDNETDESMTTDDDDDLIAAASGIKRSDLLKQAIEGVSDAFEVSCVCIYAWFTTSIVSALKSEIT